MDIQSSPPPSAHSSRKRSRQAFSSSINSAPSTPKKARAELKKLQSSPVKCSNECAGSTLPVSTANPLARALYEPGGYLDSDREDAHDGRESEDGDGTDDGACAKAYLRQESSLSFLQTGGMCLCLGSRSASSCF
jgi:hypothetical protein